VLNAKWHPSEKNTCTLKEKSIPLLAMRPKGRGFRVQILSCEHCQTVEDGEIIWGCGNPVLLSDIKLTEAICPNCHAQLHDWEFVLVDFSQVTQLFKCQAANTGGF
jgi:hypothetical protein